jgi:hypothetical protein
MNHTIWRAGIGLAAGAALAACGSGPVASPHAAPAPAPRVVVIGASIARVAPEDLARSTLASAPIPQSARRVRRLPIPLGGGVGLDEPAMVDVSKLYVLASVGNLARFLETHAPRGSTVVGPEFDGSNRVPYSMTQYTVTLPTSNQHVSLDMLGYETTSEPNGTVELRVDAAVVWLPIRLISLPTTGDVTVTGYGGLSDEGGSSAPFTVRLNDGETLRLAQVLEGLPAASADVLCSGGSTLFSIRATTTPRGPLTWSGTADVCPGVLTVHGYGATASFDARTCSLERVVASLFPPGAAMATRATFTACQYPSEVR